MFRDAHLLFPVRGPFTPAGPQYASIKKQAYNLKLAHLFKEWKKGKGLDLLQITDKMSNAFLTHLRRLNTFGHLYNSNLLL